MKEAGLRDSGHPLSGEGETSVPASLNLLMMQYSRPAGIVLLLGLFILTTVPPAQARPSTAYPLPAARSDRPTCTVPPPSGRPPAPSILRALLLYGPAPLRTLSETGEGAARRETVREDSLFKQPQDPWLALDKVQHLTFSFLWTLGAQYALVNKGSWSEGRALPLSIGLSAGIGLAKELYDWRLGPRRYFSRRDLAADALGIFLATGLILL